ncbi:hypothetical protein AW736_18515 [Termitidicoccus mucosus]|uniref:Sulfatase N-terminal domain-containing protein n=2 Tax=Termitidicoccus mucosus TaxID=1184151 RepID=A0A178IEW7_9BACT|nr:hypothetical protein AW736_18515 [Opitutaceae bacterium TSB47]
MKTHNINPFEMLAFGALTTAPGAVAAQADGGIPPNIVIIVADDMGWNQVGYHGGAWYETPNIDRIAREGTAFTQAYAAAPVCSPSRAALMTGKAPARLHLTDFIPGTAWEGRALVTPKMEQGLPLAEKTIAERLRERGYINGLFGKWHLAPDYDYTPGRPMDPESQGFDVVFHVRKPSPKKLDEPDAHNVGAITGHAVDFIQANRDRPFFCYIAHNVVHTPLVEESLLTAKYANKPGAGRAENNAVMAAMIERMDAGIGRILDTLDRLDLSRRTLVVFISDNGNLEQLQSQHPFRGGKASLWQGGLRVPMCARWPGKVRAGMLSDAPTITQDVFFTVLDAAGCDTSDLPPDGVSLLAHLSTGAALPSRALYWHYPHYHQAGGFQPGSAIREGNHMLIEWHEGALLGVGPAASLFDISADPGQQNDLAAQKPELVVRLRAKLAQWRRDVSAQEMLPREGGEWRLVPSGK